MIKKVIFISILCLSGAVFTASEKAGEVKPLPKGDPIRGEKLVGSCAACHGAVALALPVLAALAALAFLAVLASLALNALPVPR